jgi:predicted phage tail component-like protein
MYNFIDVTETSNGTSLPSEALKINGEYIENLIDGYRTLHVLGREALSPELETYSVGVRDGEKLKSKRYPPRTIVVTYQLMAETNEAFREAYNKLGNILNVKNAKLIFNDESDKYFIGTPSLIGEIEPGRNNVVGTIEFLCVDPFKYSTKLYTAHPVLDEASVLIDYNGTYRAYPTLQATFYDEKEVADDGETAGTLSGNGDCGYVAFFNESKNIIQLGDPEEADTETYAKSQTLMSQGFGTSTSWGKAAAALWNINSGNPIASSHTQLGSMTIGAAAYTGGPKETTGSLVKVRSSKGSPRVDYSVSAKTSERTEESVKVSITITTSLEDSSSGIGTDRELKASVYIGGKWNDKVIKTKKTAWSRDESYTSNLVVTVTGLKAEDVSLTDIKFKVERTDSLGQAGILDETECNDLKISAYTAPTISGYHLTPSSYGSLSGKWHGPAISRSVPADAAGDAGAANFVLSYAQKMCIDDSKNAQKQLGGFVVNLTDANGKSVIAVHIYKSKAGTIASVVFYVNGEKVYGTDNRDISYASGMFGSKAVASEASMITKSGKKVVFEICGLKKTIYDADIANKKVTKMTFMFEKYSTSAALAYNGLRSVKFVKNNCDTYEDIPNKFGAGDVVTADCSNGVIRLNGVVKTDLGALGNDWEEFYLTPGLNQVGFAYSDFVDDAYAPEIAVKYREVFL